MVSPAARLLARESKATNRPSALITLSKLSKLPSVPSLATDTRSMTPGVGEARLMVKA